MPVMMSQRIVLLMLLLGGAIALAEEPREAPLYTFWVQARTSEGASRYIRIQEDTVCAGEQLAMFVRLEEPSFVYAIKFRTPNQKIMLHASTQPEKAETDIRLGTSEWVTPDACDDTEAIYVMAAPRPIDDKEQWQLARTLGMRMSPPHKPCDDGVLSFVYKGTAEEQRTKKVTRVKPNTHGLAALRFTFNYRSCEVS